MESLDKAPLYHVWGIDNVPYGPVELPMLVHWVQEERVHRDSWIFSQETGEWTRAREVPEIKLLFHPKQPGTTFLGPEAARPKVKPGALRRIKIFSQMEDSLLEVFVRYAEVVNVNQFATVVTKGTHGDAMYMVLEGELRARSMVDGKETILSIIEPGEFFGEISILDHGPRSADIVANKPAILLRISASGIERILKEAPAMAAPFLHGLGRSISSRLRTLTKRYEDSIHFSRIGAGQA